MSAIDRDELARMAYDYAWNGEGLGCVADGPEQRDYDFADRILALVRPVQPVAFTRDRVRTELLASLPADPKWVAWVDGVLDRLEASS